MMRFARTLTVLSIGFVVSVSYGYSDWTRFRGPNGSGDCTTDKPVPVKWSASTNLKWKTDLPGAGVSSPIIVGDRVYLTTYSGYGMDRQNPGNMGDLKRHLVCIDRADGRIVWDKTIDPVLPEDPYSGPGVPSHGYATNTPVSDGTNVYVFLGKTGVLAFDKDGKQLWQTAVGTESDPQRWGSAASPILYKNLVIVPASAESEALVGLDKKTGKEVWRQEASGLSNSWSTPIIVKVDDSRTDLVIGASGEIWGMNPDTGKLRWYSEGINGDRFYSSTIAKDGIVYAIEGGEGASLAVRAGGKGNVTDSQVVWKGRTSNSFGTPVIHNGRIYVISGGIISVIDAKSGKRISRNRLASKEQGRRNGGGDDYASPIVVDDKIYYVRRNGTTHVLSTTDDLEQLAVNQTTSDDEVFSATPAVGDGELYLRSDRRLYCIAGNSDDSKSTSAGIHPTKLAAADDAPGGGRRGGRGGGRMGNSFAGRDKNGDGKLSGKELTPRMRSQMAKIDTDKDGAISEAEFDKEMAGRNARRAARRRNTPSTQTASKPKRPRRPEMEG